MSRIPRHNTPISRIPWHNTNITTTQAQHTRITGNPGTTHPYHDYPGTTPISRLPRHNIPISQATQAQHTHITPTPAQHTHITITPAQHTHITITQAQHTHITTTQAQHTHITGYLYTTRPCHDQWAQTQHVHMNSNQGGRRQQSFGESTLVPEETSLHLLLRAWGERLDTEENQLPRGPTEISSGTCQETETGKVWACHAPRQPLNNHLSGNLEGGWRLGRQRRYWMDNFKEWTSLPRPGLLTMAPARKD